MENNNSPVIGQTDILQLYELSMSIGQSLDLKENCEAFFRVLIRRKNLGLVSFWLWSHDYVADKAATANLVYISPGFRRTISSLPISHDSFLAFSEATGTSISSENPLFKRIAVERVPGSGIMGCFKVGEIGIVKLFFFERTDQLSVLEANQFQSLFSKFSVSIQGCLEHERLRQQMVMNHRLVLAINQSEEMVVILNRHLEIEYYNEAFVKNYSLQGEKLSGCKFEDALNGNPLQADFKEIQRRLTLEGRWRSQIKYFAANGELKFFDTLINPVFGGNGDIDEYMILQKDVTQEMAFEERRRQSQKLEAMGTLAGGIAHDFNNILLVIMGNIELVTTGKTESEMSKKCLKDAYDASRRAQELVRRILLFSRNEKPAGLPVPIDSVVIDAVRMLRATIPSNINIETRIEFRGYVKADMTQLHQIILNLCTNAFKAISGSGNITVRLCEADLEDLQNLNYQNGEKLWICLSVSDTGIGISPEIIGRIFDPFFTTRPTGEGSGLGLSVVHGIVQQLGGAVSVESVVGEGAVFKVFLPLADVEDYLEQNNVTEIDVKKCRLLVVDDEKMVGALYRRGLARAGYDVTVFSDSVAALKAFSDDPQGFDVVITDMMMPGITGDKLAEEILNLRPEIPIILCSGYLRDLNEEKLYQIGIKAFIEKPLIVNDLIRVISRYL